MEDRPEAAAASTKLRREAGEESISADMVKAVRWKTDGERALAALQACAAGIAANQVVGR
jgi:hypothetical protein